MRKLSFAIYFFTVALLCWAQPTLSDESDQAEEQLTELEAAYLEFRDRLFERYTEKIEQIDRIENNYVPAFVPNSDLKKTDLSLENSAGLELWWQDAANKKINLGREGLEEDVLSLFSRALRHSSQIKVFADLPLIRETSIQEADGPFDFRMFVDGRIADIDEPVGDDLRTGGPLRYLEDSRSIEYGLGKKFITGTEVELKQRIGDMDTNSIYFNPEEQARAGTFLTIRQPLLKGFGIAYQKSAIELAKLDHAISEDELRRMVESHLMEVSRAYWGLYLERSIFLQKQRLAFNTYHILNQMEARAEMDVTPGLLARARSLVKSHELAAFQAEYAMRNAQSRIMSLINDPEFLEGTGAELVTSQQPMSTPPDAVFTDILNTALLNRPEIAQGVRQIQASAIREARSRNELRPDLDFVFDTYVKGLEGDYDYSQAYSNQFDVGDPSYMAGLRFEFPLGNNSAQARNTRRRLEARQLLNQLDVSVEHVLLEVQVSHREMQKYYESMLQSYQIMKSDEEEIREILESIDYKLAQGDPYGDMLYRLMDASERLTESEETVVRSELTYNLALYNLYRAMGILVTSNNFVFNRSEGEDDLPLISVGVDDDNESTAQ